MNQYIWKAVALAVVLALVLPGSAIFTASKNTSDIDWWPMYHHDLNHTGYSTSSAPDIKNIIWTYIIDIGRIYSSPSIIDGKLYFGSEDNYVYCLNATDGSLIWNHDTGNVIHSSPAIADGKIFISSGNNLYCLNASDGPFIWKYDMGFPKDYGEEPNIESSPAVADGRVYVGSDNNNLYCLDAENGSFIWNYTTFNDIDSSPAVANGRVYVGSGDHNLYCLDATDGDLIWSYTTGDNIISSPAVADGKVYFGSWDNYIYCLDASDGDLIWKYDTEGYIWSSPAVAYGKIYIGSYNNLYCLDATDGSLIWNYTAIYIISSPAVADKKIYFGSTDCSVYCLNATDGSLIWMDTDSRFRDTFSPAVADERMYISRSACCGMYTGSIFCFGPSYDHDTGIISIDNPISGPATIFTPEVIVKNFGLNDETDVPVNLEIARFEFPDWVVEYNNTTHIDIDAGETSAVAFPEWTPENLYGIPGTFIYRVTACTQLPDDNNPDNDCNLVSITLDYIHDVGIKEITEPSEGEWPLGTYPVECIVKNYGSFNESDFNVNATIYNETEEIFYHDDFLVIPTMHLQDEITVDFENVTFESGDEGDYRLEIATELNEDDNPLNNQAILIFTIGDSDAHTIFAEFATATTCNPCKYAHAALKNIYTSGQYPFYYVSLVSDKNPIAYDRIENDYNTYGYPTVFFDGGYEINIGGGTNNEEQYKLSIGNCGNRTVSDINITLDVIWLGGTEMKINVSVDNNETNEYEGHIRVYITEIVSSMGWIDTAGYPYTFAFLDYAFDEDISISSEDTWNDSIIWNGSNHGYNNITRNNTMVIASVFNSEWHQGYANPPDGNPFDAYYVDETTGAMAGDDRPILEIGDISGGLFKVDVAIRNIGSADAVNVNWNITLDGGLLLLDGEAAGIIPNISVGEEIIVSSDSIFGLGIPRVTVVAEIPDITSDMKEQKALVLLFIIKMMNR